MTRSEQDSIRIVRNWLGDGSTTLSDRVRAGVLGGLPMTRQESTSLLRRRPAVAVGAFRIAIALAAAVVVLVAGASLLPRTGGLGGGASPASLVPPSSSPVPNSFIPNDPPLAPGPHLITEVAPITLRITLPAGWTGGTADSTRFGKNPWWVGNDQGRGAVSFTTNVDSPCLYDATLARTSVTIDGFSGQRMEFPSDSACHPNALFDTLGAPPGRGPDWLVTMWVLNVDGVDLIMIASTGPPDAAELNVLRRLVESVEIEAPPAPR